MNGTNVPFRLHIFQFQLHKKGTTAGTLFEGLVTAQDFSVPATSQYQMTAVDIVFSVSRSSSSSSSQSNDGFKITHGTLSTARVVMC